MEKRVLVDVTKDNLSKALGVIAIAVVPGALIALAAYYLFTRMNSKKEVETKIETE